MATGRMKVLIVEDETLVGMGIQDALTKMGHEVVGQAASQAEALEQFKKLGPDLVLIDIQLDGGDGIELAKEIAQIRRVPMLILSAFSDAELVRRAGEAGVFGYLIKPGAAAARGAARGGGAAVSGGGAVAPGEGAACAEPGD